MEDTNKVPNDEIVKALGEFLSEEEVQDILQKASPAEEKEEEGKEKEEGEEEYGDMEKSYGAKKSEYEEMTKALETKKAEMEELEKKMGCKKGEEDDLGEGSGIEKSEKDDILKGFVDGLTDRLSKSEEAQSEIMKSLETFSENQGKILETIERIGSQPIGLKSARSLNFIEKGGMEEEDGKKTLHLQRDKAEIEKALDELIDSTEDPIKKGKYESELLNYNAGGTPISKSLRTELESKSDFVIL